MTRRFLLPIASVCLLLSLGISTELSAYVVYSTSEDIPPETCTLPQPQKLTWRVDTVPFWVEIPSVDGVAESEAVAAVQAAYEHWNESANCQQPFLQFEDALDGDEYAAELRVGFDPDKLEENKNVFIWVDNPNLWNHGPGVLGLTTLTYNTCNGKVVDGDIEVNAGFFPFSVTGDPGPLELDLQNTVTHEVGHLLGLDHSLEPEATMFFNSPEGETGKRSIEEDDRVGLCCLYCSSQSHVPGNRCTQSVWTCDEVETPEREDPGCFGPSCLVGCQATSPNGSGFCGLILMAIAWCTRRARNRIPLAAQAR